MTAWSAWRRSGAKVPAARCAIHWKQPPSPAGTVVDVAKFNAARSPARRSTSGAAGAGGAGGAARGGLRAGGPSSLAKIARARSRAVTGYAAPAGRRARASSRVACAKGEFVSEPSAGSYFLRTPSSRKHA